MDETRNVSLTVNGKRYEATARALIELGKPRS